MVKLHNLKRQRKVTTVTNQQIVPILCKVREEVLDNYLSKIKSGMICQMVDLSRHNLISEIYKYKKSGNVIGMKTYRITDNTTVACRLSRLHGDII